MCSLVTKCYNEWYCFANTQQLVKLVQFRRDKREGLPDGVAVLKVEQTGQLGGDGRAKGTRGDVNEEEQHHKDTGAIPCHWQLLTLICRDRSG